MRQTILRIFFCVALPLLTGAPSFSQVVVERSTEKAVISGKQYYIHTVKKGETAYSISKAYGIRVDDLTRENPAASAGIKEGQILRIPVVTPSKDTKQHSEPSRDENRFIYHHLSSGDTVFSLAKKYGVSEDEIVQSNPGMEINKLPVGSEIAIPKRQFATTAKNLESDEKDYISYKVSRGESITSIAEKFGITVKELRKENRGIIFPRVDEYLRIPVSKAVTDIKNAEPIKDTLKLTVEEPVQKTDRATEITHVGHLEGKYNIALLLPLWFKENAQRTEIDSSQVLKGRHIKRVIQRPDQWIYPESLNFLELYEGALVAADTLRSLGLDVGISVFDIDRDTVATVELIKSGKLDSMNLIIGPVYSQNLGIVADYAGSKGIPVISPVPLKSDNSLQGRPLLYMAFPSLAVAQQAISKRICDYYNDNFVFIHSDTAGIDPTIGEFKNLIFKELSSKMPYDDIRFKEFIFYSKSSIGSDSINRLEHALSEKTENIVLIASEESPVLSETLMDLHTLSKKYPVKVIGYPAMRDIDNLEPKYYFELGIELYSPYWIDYGREDVRRFIRSYHKKFLTEPSEGSFAWQGFDITYFFVTGLAMHGTGFLSDPGMHRPDLLESEYDYERMYPDSGFENRKLFLIKYSGDMDVKKLDDNALSQH